MKEKEKDKFEEEEKEDSFENEEKEEDYDNMEINDEDIEKECYYDNIKDETDLLIGFDPDVVLKNREELKINLIYFDKKLTKSNDSYDYYKKFKVNVVGGFYASDETDIFQKYLDEIDKLKNVPPYLVVTKPIYFEELYNICNNYYFIKEIILIDRTKNRYENYLKTHKSLLKHISKDYNDLIDYLKKIGDYTTNWNAFFRLFNKNRMFTSNEIKMDRQLSTCPIITAYEYDELYFTVHRAYAHFFTNDSLRNDPRYESPPNFGKNNFNKIKSFLEDIDIEDKDRKTLIKQFEELKDAKNFTEDAIRKYTGESLFCYLLNRVMRNFEKGLIKLAYYVGPLLFGLNQYALEHPELCLNKDTILYRKLEVSPLDKYNYKLSVGHIICFPALTSTSIISNKFKTTQLGKKINDDSNKNVKEKTPQDDKVIIEMIINYKHEEGNITPAINVKGLSSSPREEERLIFPFTFFRLNKITEESKNKYKFELEIINRKKIIEYDLKEGKRFNIEDLEELSSENQKINIEDGKENQFQVREKEETKSLCNIF